MDDEIPIVVRMRVECTKCGHAEEDTYEFEMPIDEAQPTEERAAGKYGSPLESPPRNSLSWTCYGLAEVHAINRRY